MKRIGAVFVMLAGLATFNGAVQAEPKFENASDAVAYRQAALKLMGAHSASLAEVMRGRVEFDAEHVRAEIHTLRTLAELPWKAFKPGMEGGNARKEVWEQSEKFKAAADALLQKLDHLEKEAESNDLARIRAAYSDAAASCKACHDNFRQRR